jgi:2-iminoacetate synthase
MPLFSEVYPTLPIDALVQQSMDTTEATVDAIIRRGYARNLREFAALISPVAESLLEPMAFCSQRITQRYFGKTIRLYAPIYLSNECVNVCKYCGFSRHNKIPRVTLPIEKVIHETKLLAKQGFRNLLLVAGEHPKYVSNGYVEECIKECIKIMPSVNLELAPAETEDYKPLVAAGCEGLTVYQETYHEPTYREMHTHGPKRKYLWRMDTPERGYEAGFRRLNISALYGLYDWRFEAISVAAHARHLMQNCWKAQPAISFIRMRPAVGQWSPDPKNLMGDRSMVQLLTAFRMLLPYAGLNISTRERPEVRNGLVQIGVTHMSAGSCTEPGGYESFDQENWVQTKHQDGEQFHIADERSPKEFAEMIRSQGYEPVWKDFDQSLVRPSSIE